MVEVVACEGAPRDLGTDQGTHCRAALRARYRGQARWRRAQLRLLAESAARRRLRLELRRFYPQQAEMLEAMARAARVPAAWLRAMLADGEGASPPADAFALAAANGAPGRGGLLARPLPADAIVRRRRPENGFRSVELVQPWGFAPLAGVNEAGLAVACAAQPGGVARARHVVPAALLALDCLRRFDRLEGAVDWLSVRPGGGRSAIALADPSGEIACVAVDGDGRTVVRPVDGTIVRAADCAARVELEKALREASPRSGSDLGRCLDVPLAVVESGRRRIGWLGARSARGADHWFEA